MQTHDMRVVASRHQTPTHHRTPLSALLCVTLLSACAQTPLGPSVQVMPGAGKPFATFAAEQTDCKQFAQQAVAGQAENANLRGAGAAVLTTALGAGLGAAIGGGRGAAIGAASGAAGGAGLGAVSSSNEQFGIQQQYDNAFSQCMYSRGNQVPGFTPVASEQPIADDPGLTRAVQVQLNRLGLLNGAADGVTGPRTSAAILRFEQGAGLPADGVPSPALLATLQSTP